MERVSGLLYSPVRDHPGGLSGIAVLGNITIDEVESEGYSYTAPGGVPVHAGLSITALGKKPVAFSNVGYDFPDTFVEMLREWGIGLAGLRRHLDAPTTRFLIRVTGGARSMRLIGRCRELALEGPLDEYEAVYLGPVEAELGYGLIRMITSAHDMVLLDPQGLIRLFGRDGEVSYGGVLEIDELRGLRILRLSDEEASSLGFDNPREAAAGLSRKLRCITLVSSASHGTFLCEYPMLYHLPAIAGLKVRDSTGAGDVLGGGFLSAYVERGDPAYALALGSALAAQRLERIGPGPLSGPEAERRADELYQVIERHLI